MRGFRIGLASAPADSVLFVEADDFNTERETDTTVYFNFWVQPEEGDAYSVAAVPFENVTYIVEKQKP